MATEPAAPSLRTYLWLAGSLFILAACLSFLAFLKLGYPWWLMVCVLGALVGGVVACLEQLLMRPLERLLRMPARLRDGVPLAPPGGRWVPLEFQKLWRGLRAFQEHHGQTKQAQRASEDRAGLLNAQARMLTAAGQALSPELPLERVAPGLLQDLTATLGVAGAFLVPLRRHCPVPVLGPEGQPGWAEALRASGLTPWEDLLAQDELACVCLSPAAPEWRAAWEQQALWVVPLNYHGKAQGLVLVALGDQERIWTPEERALLRALSRVLAAALHPPRWSEERRAGREAPERGQHEARGEGQAGDPGDEGAAALAGAPQERQGKRRQKGRRA